MNRTVLHEYLSEQLNEKFQKNLKTTQRHGRHAPAALFDDKLADRLYFKLQTALESQLEK